MVTLPKISVVIPSFNKARFIEESIRSVWAQHYPSYEIIVFDNCSTDNTREILSGYPEVDLVIESDHGQSDALNKGFRRARGDIIAWLNADDYFLPGVFERVVEHLEAHPETDMLYGDYFWVDREGRYVKELRLLDFNVAMSIYCGMNIPGTLSFIRKRVFEEGHYLDVSFRYLMDMEFVTRLGKCGKRIVHLPGVYFGCFRMYGSNMATRHKNMAGEAGRREWNAHLLEHRRFRGLHGPVKSDVHFSRAYYFLMKRYWRSRMVAAKALRGLYFSRLKYYFKKPETRASILFQS